MSIGPGEILQATYQFRVINPQNDNTTFRVALLNSGGSRVSDDSVGISNSTFSAYTGYAAFLNPVTDATDTHSIRQRVNENNGLLHVGGAFTPALSIGEDPLNLVEGTLYTGIFSVGTTGTGLLISHQILSGDTLLSFLPAVRSGRRPERTPIVKGLS